MIYIKTYESFDPSIPDFESHLDIEESSKLRHNFGGNGCFHVSYSGTKPVIVGYALWNDWARKGLGEEFMIANLKMFKKEGIDELYSIIKGRNKFSNNLWDRLEKRDDVIVERNIDNKFDKIKLK